MGGLDTFPAALVAALFSDGVNGQDRAALVTQLAGISGLSGVGCGLSWRRLDPDRAAVHDLRCCIAGTLSIVQVGQAAP
jgi:hypothetical protein